MTGRGLWLLATLVLVALFLGSMARAGEIILTDPGTPVFLGAEGVEYLYDPSGETTVQQVAGPLSGQFQAIGATDFNRGFSHGAHWLRLTLVNRTTAPLQRWLEIGHARIEQVSFFEHGVEGWRETRAGTQVPRRDKAIVAATPVLPLSIPAGTTCTILVRVQSMTAVDLAGAIWEPSDFRAVQGRLQGGQAVFLGAIGLAAVFSVLIFFLIRSFDHLFFGVALICFFFYESSFNGMLFQYGWPADRPFVTWTITLWAGGSIAFILLFYRTFLNLPRLFPRWDRVCLGLVGILAVHVYGAIFHSYYIWTQVALAIGVAEILIGCLLGAAALRKGHKAAHWFLAAMAAIWLALLPHMLAIFGYLEMSPTLRLSVPAAVVVASILTLVAVTDRLKKLQQEKELADVQAIARLEDQVHARTCDLQVALAEAREANKAKTSFLAQISHDLRTPLHTVIGYAQLIQRGSERIPPRDGAGAIERSARRLLALIDELLNYVRGDVGLLRAEPQPVYWQDVLRRIADDAEHLCDVAGNHFSIETFGVFPVALALDEPRLRQILDNLLSNANRHTRHGRITLRILASIHGSSTRLDFHVEDNGEGIPAEKVDQIFEPFVSGSQGTGLGLAISRHLVAALGGDLKLVTTSPTGSCFAFHIFCPQLDEADVPISELASFHVGYRGPRQTILVVDDVRENRDFLCELLSGTGFDVKVAEGGRKALELLDDRISLVLTDQSMPDGDGWFLLQEIQERALWIPVVLISAAPPMPPADFPPDAHFASVLLKPVECDVLLNIVGSLLGLQWEDRAETATVTAPYVVHLAADDAAELLRLLDSGDVTSIEEMAAALNARGEEFADLAGVLREGAARLDFNFLRGLANRRGHLR